MSDFVLDGSVTLAWCFPDERTPAVMGLRVRVETGRVIVPPHWALEVGNVLVLAERKGRINAEQRAGFATELDKLPIVTDHETCQRSFGPILDLARTHQLTTYDAAYLDVAIRYGLPLATLDQRLRIAAEKQGVALLGS